MKILVAGGAGYVGSRLVPELKKLGHNVTVLDLLWFDNNLDTETAVIKKDVFEVNSTDLQGFDQVIFIAGLSNDPMAEFSPSMNYIANAAAPAYLAYISKNAGVKRFIYGCSGSVYGFTNNELSTEDSPAISKYPYGISKLQGEYGVMQVNESPIFSVISIRKGTVSGYSPRMRFDLIVNTMYMKAMTEGKITINNPAIWRPILAISDAVQTYIKAVEAEQHISGIFNACSINATVGEVGEAIKKYFRERFKKNIETEIKNIQDFRNYKISNEKAKSILKVDFTGSTESILDELNEYFKQGFDFTNDKYYNIKIFRSIFDKI